MANESSRFFAVCDANGPISVALDGSTLEQALASFAALDTRAAIDEARTDAEDELDISGEGMGESEFDDALRAAGATPEQPLGEIDQHGRTVAGDWYLWSVSESDEAEDEDVYEALDEALTDDETPSESTLQRAHAALVADGYSPQWYGNGGLYVPVSDDDEGEADEALASIRALLGDGYTVDYSGNSNTDADGCTTSDVQIEAKRRTTNSNDTAPAYQLDADMLGSGSGFTGTAADLQEFLEILAEQTGRPESDFVIRQHVNQWAGAVEPDECDWNAALETFVARRPDLFD